jgi:hypothetical protein
MDKMTRIIFCLPLYGYDGYHFLSKATIIHLCVGVGNYGLLRRPF